MADISASVQCDSMRDIKVNEAPDNYKRTYLKAYAFMDKLKQNCIYCVINPS